MREGHSSRLCTYKACPSDEAHWFPPMGRRPHVLDEEPSLFHQGLWERSSIPSQRAQFRPKAKYVRILAVDKSYN